MTTHDHRLRITFAKGEAIRYCSHLDLARAWERSLRRANVPLAYSRGFNPRPRLQIAAALPLGHTGDQEMLDAWLEQPMSAGDITASLDGKLPGGLWVQAVRPVVRREPALQTRVASAVYRATVEWEEPTEAVEGRIAGLLAAEALPHERKGRPYDMRPLVEDLWLEQDVSSEVVLGMQLAARPGATVRPEAVLHVLGMGAAYARHHRRRLMLAATEEEECRG